MYYNIYINSKIIMENNQKLEELKQILGNDGVIIMPTDTIWWISCLANSEIAIDKINQIKKRDESKTMIILMTKEIFAKYISYDYKFDFEYPTTVIYDQKYCTDYFLDNVCNKIIRNDWTIAIRIVNDIDISQTINYLQKPIVSTSANISWEPWAISFGDIKQEVIDQVDHIYQINWRKPKTKPSNIVKIEWDQIIYIRK